MQHDPHAPQDEALPFDTLTADLVLDALASLGLPVDGRLSALNSYENRVYLAGLDEGEPVVTKFYRPGRWRDAQIQEEHDFAQALADAEVPMVAPMRWEGRSLHHHEGFAFSVSPARGGRLPELDDAETLEWVGRFLARLHTVGAAQPFTERPRIDLQSFGLAPREWLLSQDVITPDQQTAWAAACQEALAVVADTPLALDATSAHKADLRWLRLHGDCHAGNVLWTPTELPGGGPHFVDLDDARTGFAVQDLWMLATGSDPGQRLFQLAMLVEGYEQFRPFDRRELALIEPLRTLRLIHYSAWLAQRRHEPAFERAFPWFGTSAYWAEQTALLRSQVSAMQAPPPWL